MSRPLTIKEFIKQYPSSSVDKVTPHSLLNKQSSTTSSSTKPRPSSKNQIRNTSKNKLKMIVTNIHPHKKQTPHPMFHRLPNQHKLSVEGDLNFNHSQTYLKHPITNTTKNTMNVFNIMNNNNNSQIQSHKHLPSSNNSNSNSSSSGIVIKKKPPSLKHRPKKSPIPIRDTNRSKHYLSKSNYTNNNSNNNSINNTLNRNFVSNSKPFLHNGNHTSTNRALSPLTRTKINAPKLSPNLVKPKYKSKSPILSQSISQYRKIKSNYLGPTHTRSVSTSSSLSKKNKKDLISNRPKSSMSSVRRPKGTLSNTNRSNDVSSKVSNVSNNNHNEDVNVDDGNKIHVNTMIRISKTPKQECSVEEQEQEHEHDHANVNVSISNNEIVQQQQPQQMQLQQQQIIKPIFKAKIKNIYEFTHVGFDGEKNKDNNQDSLFIKKNFAGNKDYIYMSVCDGHGVEGHFVSRFVKKVLPEKMSKFLRNVPLLNTSIQHEVYNKITEAFLLTNRELVEEPDINSFFSGSTCVSVIFTPEKLICPNIGDSRAVLGRYIDNEWKAIELSRDHKPTEPDEEQRILENNGRIQPFTDEDGEFVGPKRVWIQEDDVPGLAMSRSFGDRVAATVGVISAPEIKEMELCEDDKFMIIASDGIWEFIDSQECVEIVKDYYENNDMKGCSDYLYEISKERWLKEEEVIDDITLILVFFE